ncbi:MAG: hypothetical protein V4864_11135, partial [Pseudomonadota bacterium]
ANTFRPYDPARVQGDSTPYMPAPAPKKKSFLGQLLALVATIVVAYFTGVYMSGPLESSVVGTVAGAAAGSIAGQAVNIAAGNQEKFSWKQVALSALSAGVTQGLPADFAAGLGTTGQVIAKAAVGNAITQGIGVVTGLQKSFDWRGVAASAVGAGVGQAVSEPLGNAFGPTAAGQFGARLATGLIAGTASAVMRGGKVAIQQVAVDAFGNALGSGLVDTMLNPTSQAAAPQLGLFGSGSYGVGDVDDLLFASFAGGRPVVAPTTSVAGATADPGNLLDLPSDYEFNGAGSPANGAHGERLLRGMRDRDIDAARAQAARAQWNALRRANEAQAAGLRNLNDPAAWRSASAYYAAAQAQGLRYGGASGQQDEVRVANTLTDVNRISESQAESIAVALGGGMAFDSSITDPYVASGLTGPQGYIGSMAARGTVEFVQNAIAAKNNPEAAFWGASKRAVNFGPDLWNFGQDLTMTVNPVKAVLNALELTGMVPNGTTNAYAQSGKITPLAEISGRAESGGAMAMDAALLLGPASYAKAEALVAGRIGNAGASQIGEVGTFSQIVEGRIRSTEMSGIARALRQETGTTIVYDSPAAARWGESFRPQCKQDSPSGWRVATATRIVLRGSSARS